ncbi:uncharacterized protein BO95DRAFT_517960 [Aspergillus brunneoviolaceus CBS 621.78]|uniref:Uncharacterized protein n=1 Tax=Aspergillus brunneoviolaceus CBS 621.78 TaxID=1450534 RepID=A0ACD1FWU0_9EURO|nr:hypothetical protein BO95DRAFT_517960 [Aspergillus brunneoviolaceus CBS 621.78]RAH41439.1 hypothetical protein BO95DRAFT_517960 [Aspergillus brunneoviolaceus CBS 621.78]
MYPQTPLGYSGPMTFSHGGVNPGEGIEDLYAVMQPQWTGLEASPYGGINHPYTTTTAFPTGSILTPISLPDSSFRPSPVLSHHSQEFQYNTSDTVPSQGLGITAPFPSNFPRTVTAGLGHTIDQLEYGLGEVDHSPRPPPAKRARRGPKQAATPREAPVTILPNPEGLQRLEQERRQGAADAQQQQRPRAPGRGRRDPQAEEEDAFVERLREQNLAWKVIREMFREKFHKDASEARLQMRMLRRRKERLARWDENDVIIQIRLLIRARDYWEHEKYNVIAQKMRELGAGQYTPQQCEAQLRYLDAQNRDRSGLAARPRISETSQTRRRVWPRSSPQSLAGEARK